MDDRETEAREVIEAVVQCVDDGIKPQKTSPIYDMARAWLKNEPVATPDQKKEDRS